MLLSNTLNDKSNPASSESSVPLVYLAYARVSTEDQGRMRFSIPAQIKEMHAFAVSRNIEIAEVFREKKSNFSDKSHCPRFNEMINKAKEDPRISGILLHDSSRFFRDSHAALMEKEQLLENCVSVVSVTENRMIVEIVKEPLNTNIKE